MTREELKNIISELIREILDELNELSTSSGAGSYLTPNAFSDGSSKSKKRIKKIASRGGYNVVNETTYRAFKGDKSKTPRQKINLKISEINGRLYKIDRMVDQVLKLKQESGEPGAKYWGVTKNKIQKISTRTMKLSEKIRKLGF